MLHGHTEEAISLAFAPDGRTLLSGSYDTTVRLWDLSTQKEIRRFAGPVEQIRAVAFAPDGKTVAAGGLDGEIRLWDPATGKEVRRLTVQHRRVNSLAFSPDGQMLAAGDMDRTVRLWEVATGKLLRELHGHEDSVTTVAFAPDGAVLGSAGEDGTVLLWDLADRIERERPKRGPLTAGELETLWNQLARPDPPGAQRAMYTLALAPPKTVPFLRGRLQPVPAVDPQWLRRRIQALSAESFPEREEATRELQEVGDRVERALQQALPVASPEARRRIERLLGRLAGPSPEGLQAQRGVRVLATIGNPEARKVLRALAQGDPAARLTREAQQALDRLGEASLWP